MRRLLRDKGKLPLIYFKCNEFGDFVARYPNKSKSGRNDKKDQKDRKNKDYKEKGKQSCYIIVEDHTESNTDDEKEIVEMVYVDVKEDTNEERYENEKSLISHVSKNDTWIVDSGFSHHMTGDISKFDKLEEINDGGTVKLGNDVPCPLKGRGSLTLNDKIKCDDAY